MTDLAVERTTGAIHIRATFAARAEFDLGVLCGFTRAAQAMFQVAWLFTTVTSDASELRPYENEPLGDRLSSDYQDPLVREVRYASPFYLHVELLPVLAGSVPALYWLARRIATFEDDVQADRERARAEAEMWRQMQSQYRIEQLEAWAKLVRKESQPLELRELEISEEE